MKCHNCGLQLSAGSSFCGNCGVPFNANAQNGQAQMQNSQMPANQQQAPLQTAPVPEGGWKAIVALVTGILALCTWLFPIIGFVFSILAIIFGSITVKTNKKGLAIAGIVLGGISIVLSILMFLFTLIIIIAAEQPEYGAVMDILFPYYNSFVGSIVNIF